jgi:hypothetical protein
MFAVSGLVFTDVFAGMFFTLLFACTAVLAAFSLACAAAGVCLIGGFNPYSLLPVMPYWCGAVIAGALISLSVLAFVGLIYLVLADNQLVRAYLRYHHNQLASYGGRAVLKPLACRHGLSLAASRGFTKAAFISLAVFAVFLASGYVACTVSAGSLGFWHAWNWFVKQG